VDFSLMQSAFQGGFSLKDQTAVRTVLFLVFGAGLALWPRVAVGQTFSMTLSNAVLYLCIYTLPMGWGAVAACGAGLAAWLIQGKGLLAVAVVVVRLVAFVGGKALFVCSTSQGVNRLMIPAIWCGVALLVGYFCYDSAFYGVLTGALNLPFQLVEWIVCAVLGIGLVAFLIRQADRAPSGFLSLLGFRP
jgi:hypothetical protein